MVNVSQLPLAVFPSFLDAAFSRSAILRIFSPVSDVGTGTGAPPAIVDNTVLQSDMSATKTLSSEDTAVGGISRDLGSGDATSSKASAYLGRS